MGLEDEIRQARREKDRAENLRLAWAASPFWQSDPLVETPGPDIAASLNEALPLLRQNGMSTSVFVDVAPDGTTRVTFNTVQRKGGVFKSDWPGENQYAWKIDVLDGGKDGPNLDLIILNDGRIGWAGDGSASADEVRDSLIKALA